MAVKKKAGTKKVKSAKPKAGAAKDSAKKSSTKAKKSAGTKVGTKGATAKKAAKPKAAAVKLSSSQHELLKKVHGAGESGYSAEKKVEERSLTALQEKKLIKKGAKDKATGKVPYSVTATGRKHVESQGGGTGGAAAGGASPTA
jgi:hypothetical protein